jgi:hypothetical protein
MAQAAYAYQQPARRNREQEVPARPDLKVLPGRGTDRAAQAALSPQLRAFCGVLIFAVLFISVICGVRGARSAVTLQVVIETQAINESIAQARAEGIELEVQYSIATNPDLIQQLAAEQLGMGPDDQVEYLRPLSGE